MFFDQFGVNQSCPPQVPGMATLEAPAAARDARTAAPSGAQMHIIHIC